ncbi:MAG TPA: hypothetical protein VF611_19590, partial [Pyrinomonadaceae bacterium]
MPSLLVISLHPDASVTGDEFGSYLNGLSIAAHEVSFSDPEGVAPAFGVAAYVAPRLPESPSHKPEPVPDGKSRITQHFKVVPVTTSRGLSARTLFASATAVIEIPDPPAGREYKTADVRLVVKRGGGEIVHGQVYYNVPVAPAPLPKSPNDFPKLRPVSLHLSLPAPGRQPAANAAGPVEVAPPNFESLRAAVEQVLTAETGGTAGIADLTREQCRHVAYEITWDPSAHPPPAPARPLEELYTGPRGAASDDERERLVFENSLLTHYVTHNSEAEQLSNFVFSVSAAIWCEQETRKATRAGFSFPVNPSDPARVERLILDGAETPLGFEVPAAYFYAVTANLPQQVRRKERLKMAVLSPEAQTVANVEQALVQHLFTAEPAEVNRFQSARRLRALGTPGETGTPVIVLARPTPTGQSSPVRELLSRWLSFDGDDPGAFWDGLPASARGGHLSLLLTAITGGHDPLIAAVTGGEFGVKDVGGLAAKTGDDWRGLLLTDPHLLPDFTRPGTTEERAGAFIRHLDKFFHVPEVFETPPPPAAEPAPAFDRPAGSPLDALLANYPQGFSFDGWDAAQLSEVLGDIFPGDPAAQQQFAAWLGCVRGVVQLAKGIEPAAIRFSVIEALWARGFTGAQSVRGFSPEDFREALAGSVAHAHAEAVWVNAGADGTRPEPRPGGFKPVNPGGSIVNCVPPAHLSPLGPVAYLHELLRAAENSTCDNPLPAEPVKALAAALSGRRGPLGNLRATKSNLEVPLPLIDIVNESLEHIVAADASGAVYNTATDQVGGHELKSNPNPAPGAYLHDPATMFEALPEHSTPAVPTAGQAAYDKLKVDFSACGLPYSQPLDVARTYLRQLGTDRFDTMRHFRRDVTEFVLDPADETPEFQRHLLRYPVRIDIAIEYLGITPEEYAALFQHNLGASALAEVYGFAPAGLTSPGAADWKGLVAHLDEFLRRTCLTYCEFVELWRSQFVRFGLKGAREEGFPDCEPCCTAEYLIEFEEPADAAEALRRLAIFIRLWRKLQAVPNARYTFTELRDVCEVLGLFGGANVNPDFIRQLVAFQMLRDDFGLSLTDGTPPAAGATGADRLHLLAFWVAGAAKWDWAVEHLLDQIQRHAVA